MDGIMSEKANKLEWPGEMPVPCGEDGKRAAAEYWEHAEAFTAELEELTERIAKEDKHS